MNRFLFTRRSNLVDLACVGAATHLVVNGHLLAAIATVLVVSAISVAGEVYIRENAA